MEKVYVRLKDTSGVWQNPATGQTFIGKVPTLVEKSLSISQALQYGIIVQVEEKEALEAMEAQEAHLVEHKKIVAKATEMGNKNLQERAKIALDKEAEDDKDLTPEEREEKEFKAAQKAEADLLAKAELNSKLKELKAAKVKMSKNPSKAEIEEAYEKFKA